MAPRGAEATRCGRSGAGARRSDGRVHKKIKNQGGEGGTEDQSLVGEKEGQSHAGGISDDPVLDVKRDTQCDTNGDGAEDATISASTPAPLVRGSRAGLPYHHRGGTAATRRGEAPIEDGSKARRGVSGVDRCLRWSVSFESAVGCCAGCDLFSGLLPFFFVELSAPVKESCSCCKDQGGTHEGRCTREGQTLGPIQPAHTYRSHLERKESHWAAARVRAPIRRGGASTRIRRAKVPQFVHGGTVRIGGWRAGGRASRFRSTSRCGAPYVRRG